MHRQLGFPWARTVRLLRSGAPLVIALLLILSPGAAPAPLGAQVTDLSRVALQVEDLGPLWRRSLAPPSSGDGPAVHLYEVAYWVEPIGLARFRLFSASEAAGADNWLLEEQRRMASENPVRFEPWPGLGDGVATRGEIGGLAPGFGYLFRVGALAARVEVLGITDEGLGKAGDDAAGAFDRQARRFAGLQEQRLRDALAGQLPERLAPFCPLGQPARFHPAFSDVVAALGDHIGAPSECVHVDWETRDWTQRAAGGMLIWQRDIDGIARFSDGTTTWLTGPDGIASRPARGDRLPWEIRTGRPRLLTGHAKQVEAFTASPGLGLLASASLDGTIRLWDASDWSEQRVLHLDPAPVGFAAFSPDGAWLLTVSRGAVQVWDPTSGQERCRRLPGPPEGNGAYHAEYFSPQVWSPDGKRLALPSWPSAQASGSDAATDPAARLVTILDVEACRPIRELGAQPEPVRAARWSPDGSRLATMTARGHARLWDTSTAGLVAELRGVAGTQWPELAWSPDGAVLATYAPGEEFRLWTPDGQPVASVPGTINPPAWHTIGPPAWSPDGRRLASITEGQVGIWDIRSQQLERELAESRALLGNPAWSPDGRWLTVEYDHPATVVVWDVSAGTRAWVLFPPAMPWRTAWSPDGRSVAVADLAGAIRVWDLAAPPED